MHEWQPLRLAGIQNPFANKAVAVDAMQAPIGITEYIGNI
jgi:hypothetical protein